MKINSTITDILKNFNIPVDDGIAYLLSLHFRLNNVTVFPSLLIKKMNVAGIYSIDAKGSLIWNHSLFDNLVPVVNDKWDWVEKDYMSMFAEVNKTRKGNKKNCLERMKKFFTSDPDLTKEEVLGATRLYINQVSDPQYLKTSHYFIYKQDKDKIEISELESWIEEYRSINQVAKEAIDDNHEDLSSQMQ